MKQRLVALDVLRGLTVGGMILVNTPGTWNYVYAPLRHAVWNGLTPADLVFPFFLFMMGMSMYLSLRRTGFRLDRPLLGRIVRRTAAIYLIGTAIYGLATLLGALRGAAADPAAASPWSEAFAALARVRLTGVLQRLAFAYGIGAVLATTLRYRTLVWIIGLLLALYGAILLADDGFVYGPENILSRVDVACFGAERIYWDNGVDPEGLLGLIPSVAHLLLGFCAGRLCLEGGAMEERLNRLFVFGALLLFGGLLLHYGLPLNKKVWSPSFVLATSGFASLLLALLVWAIDVRGRFRRTAAFEVFGVNPLFCYVFSEVAAILLVSLPVGGPSAARRLYGALAALMGDGYAASLLYGLLFTAFCWGVGYALYRRRICIRI